MIAETFTYAGTYTAQQSDIDDNGGGDGARDSDDGAWSECNAPIPYHVLWSRVGERPRGAYVCP